MQKHSQSPPVSHEHESFSQFSEYGVGSTCRNIHLLYLWLIPAYKNIGIFFYTACCTLLWQSLNVTSFMMLQSFFAHVTRLGVTRHGSKSGCASGQVLNTFQLSTNSTISVVCKWLWVVKSSFPFPLKFPHRPHTSPYRNRSHKLSLQKQVVIWTKFIHQSKCLLHCNYCKHNVNVCYLCSIHSGINSGLCLISTHHVPRLQNNADSGFEVPQNCQSNVRINDKVHANLCHNVLNLWATSSFRGSCSPIIKLYLSSLK